MTVYDLAERVGRLHPELEPATLTSGVRGGAVSVSDDAKVDLAGGEEWKF